MLTKEHFRVIFKPYMSNLVVAMIDNARQIILATVS